MTKENRPPRTFVEWMLQLLEERFPWLGKTADEQISGADIRSSIAVKPEVAPECLDGSGPRRDNALRVGWAVVITARMRNIRN